MIQLKPRPWHRSSFRLRGGKVVEHVDEYGDAAVLCTITEGRVGVSPWAQCRSTAKLLNQARITDLGDRYLIKYLDGRMYVREPGLAWSPL